MITLQLSPKPVHSRTGKIGHSFKTVMISQQVPVRDNIDSRLKHAKPQQVREKLNALSPIYVFVISISSLCLLWRFVTFISVMHNTELMDEVISITIPKTKERKAFMINKYDVKSKVRLYCFKQFLFDLPYLLLFIILHCISPWRVKGVWKGSFEPFNKASSLHNQIVDHRASVLKDFKKGCEDLWTITKIIFILLTFFKIPFFTLVLCKNNFPKNEMSKSKLSLRKCCDISFRELLVDLQNFHEILMILILLIISPLRVFTLFFIVSQQIDGIIADNQKQLPIVPSTRKKMINLFKTGLKVDLIQPFKIAVIAFTIHRIPKLLSIAWKGILSLPQFDKEADFFVKEIDAQFKKSIDDYSKVLCGILIIALVARIKYTLKRLRANRLYTSRLEELASKRQKYTQMAGIQRLSLCDITWDTFGRICQFLSAPDLARLSQVNRKFHDLTNHDFYWKYQFERDWKNYQRLTRKMPTFRQKSLYAYNISSKRMIKRILTEEERDRLGGSVYIMFDEAVNSLKAIPWALMIPANIFSLILLKLLKPIHGNEHYLRPRSNYLVDYTRLNMIPVLRQNFLRVLVPTLENFNNLHLDLERWYYVAETKYAAELGYLLSYIGYIIIKATSAGGYNPMRVEVNQETGVITAVRGEAHVNEIQNNVWRFLLYWVQFTLSFIYVLVIVIYQIAPIVAVLHVCGPFASQISTLAIAYMTSYIQASVIINTLSTQKIIIQYSAPFFKPWEAVRITYIYFRDIYLILSWHLFRKYFRRREEHNH